MNGLCTISISFRQSFNPSEHLDPRYTVMCENMHRIDIFSQQLSPREAMALVGVAHFMSSYTCIYLGILLNKEFVKPFQPSHYYCSFTSHNVSREEPSLQ